MGTCRREKVRTGRSRKIYQFCDWLRFLLGSCTCDPPFAKTRLSAQTLRSVAEISTNLTTKTSPLSLN